MVDQHGRIEIHSTRRSTRKRNAAAAGLAVLVVAIGLVVLAFNTAESNLTPHIVARDPLAAGLAYVIGLRGGPKTDPARRALIDALGSVSGESPAPPRLRAGAAYALGKEPTHEGIIQLSESIEHDPDPVVRAAACRAIGNSGEAIFSEPALFLALNDGEKEVRQAACDGSAILKDQRLIERLVPLVSDQEYQVRAYAVRALQAITGQTIGIDNVAWKAWYEARR